MKQHKDIDIIEFVKKNNKELCKGMQVKIDRITKEADAVRRSQLFRKAVELAFANYSKVLKDLAYYDKHGKFPEDK